MLSGVQCLWLCLLVLTPLLASSPFATPARNLWLADGPQPSDPVTRPQSLSA